MAALLRHPFALRTLLFIILGLPLLAAAAFLHPTIPAGASWLLFAETRPASEGNGPEHRPRHKGSVDLATGLYVRENDDLVVQGSPALVLRRTYLSRYRESREFGVGTTHAGEEYLIGDGERFRWASVILATGARINFTRITPGTSLFHAVLVHDETAGEWNGAELAWTGFTWALKKRDGSLSIYRGCGKGSVCSIMQSRDPYGRTIYYRRTFEGRLTKMEADDRWIAFDYDDAGRIVRAHDSNKIEVRYAYDARGRLVRVSASDGSERRYAYTDLDELASITEPGTSITNEYADGRCVRQVNRFPDRAPYILEVRYEVKDRMILRTRVTESDRTWTEYTWDERKSSTSVTHGWPGREPAVVVYERDPVSNGVTALTLRCRDRESRPVQQSVPVRPGEEERVTWTLMQALCMEGGIRRVPPPDPALTPAR